MMVLFFFVSTVFQRPLTVALFGKRILLKNHIGKLILKNDVFKTISNHISVEENRSFKVINTPNFFEEWSTPDQQMIDFMALSYPGPELFLLAVDSETSSSEDVLAQLIKLEEYFGIEIRQHLIVIFTQQKLYNSLLYLKDNNIQLEMLNENLASDCKKWGSARQRFLYDYKDHSLQVVQRRRKELKMRRSSEVETKTKSRPTKLTNESYNRIDQTPQMTSSSDAMDIDNASQGDGMTNGMRKNEFYIILMGRSGSGKSASANTILQTTDRLKFKKMYFFESNASSVPVTTIVQVGHVRNLFGRVAYVIDTPDFFRDKLTDDEEAVKLCKSFISENCVILLVFQLGGITNLDNVFMEKLDSRFGQNIREKSIVLITHGDYLQGNLEDYIHANPKLSDIVHKCGGRFHLFNNKSKDPKQVKELTKKIPQFKKASESKEIPCPFQ
ncbi:GTPase IMAP family member 8-like isoform X6 [Corythoichthys intestinalis]|uniref:GTPase IMAP family member 8-like isoform X6 n=1 Tax=Corythoichthys intestinalis TaxID=161448 RepID=UPI0025A59CBA|nr:GTPase IMAP family member 8-like isoform X6 [Corythoichthys intestinalis]